MVRLNLSAPFARHLSKYFLVLVDHRPFRSLRVRNNSIQNFASAARDASLPRDDDHSKCARCRQCAATRLERAHIKSAISPCEFNKCAPPDEHAKSLAVRKLDTSTWRVTGSGTITVTYAILWDDPGPFAAQINNSHAFMNLAMILFLRCRIAATKTSRSPSRICPPTGTSQLRCAPESR